jgi:hypothetical protein
MQGRQRTETSGIARVRGRLHGYWVGLEVRVRVRGGAADAAGV